MNQLSRRAFHASGFGLVAKAFPALGQTKHSLPEGHSRIVLDLDLPVQLIFQRDDSVGAQLRLLSMEDAGESGIRLHFSNYVALTLPRWLRVS